MKFEFKIGILFTLIFACHAEIFSQDEHRALIQGNEFYNSKDFDQASAEYEKVVQVNKNSVKGQYNLGNSRFQKKEYDKAAENFQVAITNASDDNIKAKAFHNLGNSYFNSKKYKEALDAYKNSLRLNPSDAETKHNMAQTLRIIKRQEPPPPPQDNQNSPPPPPKEDEQSKDEIDRMMDMMDEEDKKTQENKKQSPAKRRRPEKDW
jgi:tetratricopeptide (TPR) repeat protein